MRNSATILTLLTLFGCLGLFADFEVDITVGSVYSDNVFQLSDYDLDRYEDGSASLDYIESSDDATFLTAIRLKRSEKISKSLTLSGDVKFTNRYLLSNKDKSRSDVLAGVDVGYKDFSLGLSYGYYPGNYVRNYVDSDGTGELEKYEYDKNLSLATLNYRVWKRDLLMTYLKYEQYYYNEYFTEYDGAATTMGIGWKHTFEDFYLKGFYYFRSLDCDDPIEDPDSPKDGSYDSNIYRLDIETKKIRVSRNVYLRPYYSFQYEDRYFQTDLQDDFHTNRHDQMYTSEFGLALYAVKNLDITLEYRNIYRESGSDYYDNIAKYKEYLEGQVSLMFEYRFEWREGRKQRS